MEEKKNNQVQALDGSTLNDVSGGWRYVPGLRGREDFYLLSDEEIKKLTDAGFTVFDTDIKGAYTISKGMQEITDDSGYEIVKNILGGMSILF